MLTAESFTQDFAVSGWTLIDFYERINFDELVKSPKTVIPAKAGIHKCLKILDSRLRGNDDKNLTSYKFNSFVRQQ